MRLISNVPDYLRLAFVFSRGPVARGSIISLVIRVLTLGLGFLQAVFAARLLGPDGFGTVAFAVSIATIVATVAMLGFGPLAVREVARLRARADWPNLRGFLRYSGFAVAAASVLACGAILILTVGIEVFEVRYRSVVAVASVMIPPLAFILYFRGVNQGFGKILSAQFPGDLLRPILIIGTLILFFFSGMEFTAISYVTVVIGAGFIAAAAGAVAFRKTISQHVPRHVPINHSQNWTVAASPFLLVAVLGAFGAEVNTLLLGWLSDPEETGIYQPIARIAPVMLIGLQAVNVPFAPRVAALWEQSESMRLRRITWITTLTTTGATVLTCAIIIVLAPHIFSAFGDGFLAAAEFILIVSVAQIFNAACGPVGMLLSMTGHQGAAVRCQAGGLVVNTALGIWLIPTVGAYGAAIAYSGGIAVWNILMVLSVRRVLGFDPSLIGARLLLSRGSGG